MSAGVRVHRVARRCAVVAATLVLVLAGTAATAQTPDRVVSTSGVPHTDVADYRASPYWRPGMPRGANASWRMFLATSIGQITSGADLVLHTGDMVEGRWGQDVDGAGVFGPVGTYKQKAAALQLAGDTYYRFYRQYWTGLDVLWAQGDHEVGDLTATAPRPGTFRYSGHEQWNSVWRSHFGAIRHADRRGAVGVITLDPIVKWKRGILPRIPTAHLDWLRKQVDGMRRDGVRWIIVQSESPPSVRTRASPAPGCCWRTARTCGACSASSTSISCSLLSSTPTPPTATATTPRSRWFMAARGPSPRGSPSTSVRAVSISRGGNPSAASRGGERSGTRAPGAR